MGKKKMSKEERKKYEAEKAETLRVEMEKERCNKFLYKYWQKYDVIWWWLVCMN